jgi:hypothetical protein
MPRIRRLIVLAKLIDESAPQLGAMVAALDRGKLEKQSEGAKPSRWGRRFAASGKSQFAPKIRVR